MRVFLDANVLFSAAYRPRAGLSILWKLPKVQLITSTYAFEEALRNLKQEHQHNRLNRLKNGLECIAIEYTNYSLPTAIQLPQKDIPILVAAIYSKADYLITGDYKDFGKYYNRVIEGVNIMPPAAFITEVRSHL
jgi:uncharacterized protein